MRSQLRAIKMNDMDTEVPVAAQLLIPELKSALARTADEVLACEAINAESKAIEIEIARLLHANPPQPPKDLAVMNGDPRYTEWLSQSYGSNLLVTVSRPSPHLLSVEFEFHIGCGVDTVFLLYEQQNSKWQRKLLWQAPPYTEVNGAFGDFFVTAILPGDSANPWRVVAAHGKPWCTSRFSGFGIDILAPSKDPDHPQVVWHTDRGYSRGDTLARLRSTADGFELRLNAPADDSASFERKVIYHYQVAGDQVTRVEPIATDARGFVEEWLDMPWDEARGQTAPEAVAGMMAVHEQIAQSDKNANTYVSLSYGPVRSCVMKGQYEVEMIANPGGPQFYAVKEAPNGYTMVNYGTTQDERCSGPDLMKKH